MKIAKNIVRILLGVGLVVFGLNAFLQFMPMPPAPEASANFMGAMMETGYFLPMVKGLEIIAGVLLITGKYMRSALVIAAPIMLNAFLFHLFLDPAGIAGATAFLGMVIFLIASEWDGFKPMVQA